MKTHLHFAALALVAAMPICAQAMNLEDYLGQVVQKHQGLEGLRASQEAARKTREAGDMELTPRFSLQGSYLSDKKQPSMGGMTETRSEAYNATLSKLFSSGTKVDVMAKTGGVEYIGMSPATASFFGATAYGQGGLGIGLSQSLWKNAFGRSTSLRREREISVAEAEAGSYDLQGRQILASAESAFWDLLYLQEEVSIRQASLERGKKLEAWFRRRADDGISDRADTLNARALVASRELQLTASKDNLIAAEKKVRDYLEMDGNQAAPTLQGQIASSRDLQQLVGRDGRIVSLQVYLADLQAKAQAVGAREAEEATKADLVLSGSYFTNSYEAGGKAFDGTKNWDRTDTPTAQVALSWTYLFESDAKVAVRDSARAKALAAKLQSERAAREGETAWTEMVRRHKELTLQIKSAEDLLKIQKDLAKALQDKYARGRSITSEVINSEENAANAELQLTKMRAEQRKLEAQTRLFIAVKE